MIANHFNSKLGDDPLEGLRQPPQLASETQRHRQATVVRDFVESLRAADPAADVIVLGDLNDFQFSETDSILESAGLHDLIETLPANEQYSYVFEGNSETLDHILVSDDLFAEPLDYDVVHVNSEFADQASDHEPQIVRLMLADAYDHVCDLARSYASVRAVATVICAAVAEAKRRHEQGRPLLEHAALAVAETTVRVSGSRVFDPAEAAELVRLIRAL